MNPTTPKQAEIWLVNFDPTVGSEVRKTRPALVVSADDIGLLPLRIVVPITSWDETYSNFPWFVLLTPTSTNGLVKPSGADTFQIKSVSKERFVERLGEITGEQFATVLSAILICLEPREDLEVPNSSRN